MSKRDLKTKIPLSAARQIVLRTAVEMGDEEVRLEDALHRVLAEDLVSNLDNPPFDRSMMDGYALYSSDTKGATPEDPRELNIVRSVAIGDFPDFVLNRGEAARIMTGAPVPKDADSVLRVEFSRARDGILEVLEDIQAGRDISPKGEDIKAGELLLERERILRPSDIGALAATGHMKVRVKKRPVVEIISTGAELLTPGEEMKPGSIYDINSYTLLSLLQVLGCRPILLGIVRDNPDELEKLLINSGADVFLISGATSVGEKDFVPDVIKKIGSILFHGVNVRPGSPVGFGMVNGKPVFMLPGFPVSCITSFELLVTPFLKKLLGTKVKPPHHIVEGRLIKAVSSVKGRVNFVRVKISRENDEIGVLPIAMKGSGLVTTLTKADGFILVDEESEGFNEGDKVNVFLF
jgi:molybdopterin molybdotransferase